jgi:hypothetical protein
MRRGSMKSRIDYMSTESEKTFIVRSAQSQGLTVSRWLRCVMGLKDRESKAGKGRQKLPEDMKRKAKSPILMTQEEKKSLEAEAERQGMTLQEYLRLRIQRKLGLRT